MLFSPPAAPSSRWGLSGRDAAMTTSLGGGRAFVVRLLTARGVSCTRIAVQHLSVSPMHSLLHRTRWRTRARTASPGPASRRTCRPTGATRWCCGAPAPPGSSWTSPTVSSHCGVDVAAVAPRNARHRLCCRSILRVPLAGATYAVTCGHMPHVRFSLLSIARRCSEPVHAQRGWLGGWVCVDKSCMQCTACAAHLLAPCQEPLLIGRPRWSATL